ncbi:MAG: Cna B-type domain-containing protein [Atopobiaceae bacterium]|nr:Cna B-type domain-containing protein [Atopobiaceae bacterium]
MQSKRLLSLFLSALMVWNSAQPVQIAYGLGIASPSAPLTQAPNIQQTTNTSAQDESLMLSVQGDVESPSLGGAERAGETTAAAPEQSTETTAAAPEQTTETTNAPSEQTTETTTVSPEQTSESAADSPANASTLFDGTYIHIANFKQLQLIGTNTQLTTTDLSETNISTGSLLVDQDNNPICYSADAAYFLDADIEIPADGSWQLPENFTGSFSSSADADPSRIYDPTTDIIYIENPYQLAVLSADGREDHAVVTGDVSAESFGMGELVLEGLEDDVVLTYSARHRYVLSAAFNAALVEPNMLKTLKTMTPETSSALALGATALGEPALGAQADENTHVDGRDFFGQVATTIDGVQYILIGDRQQLDAINASSSTSAAKVCGAVYKVTQTRTSLLKGWNDASNVTSETAELVYPGDADLIADVPLADGSSQDFSQSKLWNLAEVGHVVVGKTYDYHDLEEDGGATYTRTVWCAVDPTTGAYDLSAHSNNSNHVSGLSYTKSGNYIVFRDIDMLTEVWGDWKPLMFTGFMYGVKAANSTDVSTIPSSIQVLTSGGSLDSSLRPTISNFNVVPSTRTQLGDIRLNLNDNSGVGFFGTITGKFSDSQIISDPAAVVNIRLQNGSVTNPAVKGQIDTTVVSGLLTGLGWVLGGALDLLLKGLTGKDNFTVQDMLTSLLNAREKDPTVLATGGFAGLILADTVVRDCEVADVTVNAVATDFELGSLTTGQNHKLVGTGGFVGHVEGETRYEGISDLLGGLVTVLSTVLNVIPGLGLGDLITVLLENALDVGRLIPTSYASPTIDGCVADHVTLNVEDGKIGVGGFAGDMVGTRVSNSVVRNANTNVVAETFGGGFVGLGRDAIIEGTLTNLGVDVLQALHPQTEFIGCSIENSTITVSGTDYLGGFAGCFANSYAIDPTVDANSELVVSGTGEYVGGFLGRGQLGTLFTLNNYLTTDADLLGTLSGLVVQLVSNNSDSSLLDVGGVAASAICGAQVDGLVTVSSGGSYVGGLVGRGDGIYIMSSADVTSLPKYSGSSASPAPAVLERPNEVTCLVSVHTDGNFAGGLVGYLTSANIGGLLGDTVGIGQYLGFTVSDTTICGVDDTNGYYVSANDGYAGGGIGWAVGGNVQDTELVQLGSVQASNHAGGFVGATGPGDLVSGEGLDVTLLGISLLSLDNLLSLAAGVRTTYVRSNVTGITSGFTVEASNQRTDGAMTEYVAGGWAGEANSVRVVDCHVAKLLSVNANMADGAAGGFLGASSAGGLAGLAEKDTNALQAIKVGDLLTAVPYLIPSYDGCSTTYVDGGFVAADAAGGFAGEFQSGKVNSYTAEGINPIDDSLYSYVSGSNSYGYTNGTAAEPWSVYNVHHVRGGAYAGGWGGKVYSGALAAAGGSGLSILGGVANLSISASELLSLASAYVPIVNYAGVNSTNPGFQVFAAHTDGLAAGEAASQGAAGGFIGYGSGVQVSYSDVNRLRHGAVSTPTALTAADLEAYSRIDMIPDALESEDGSAYMTFGDFDSNPESVPYAVAGAIYAGGYIGHMDIGSAASVGGGLQLLGKTIQLTNVLDVLSVVVSTIEHSNVYGAPGGFSVMGSSHIALHDSAYDEAGVAYSGGFAGKISGGHIQDSNVENFYYIVGEIAAGGYVGEMEPGDVAHVLDEGSLTLLGELDSVASLVQDFVPTIRNSQTTCVPCGGAVRAQCASDESALEGAVMRGMAGGYVGHDVGGQIWGMSTDVWKSERPYAGIQRECAAIRIRSVWGAEYAGGYCGLEECGSTAQTGGVSLLSKLINLNNLLGALEVVYPTVRHAAVYGPLYGVDEATFNAWKDYVGAYGGFAPELARASYADLGSFEYGTHVVAGRHAYSPYPTSMLGGTAGGFVGAMHGGTISNSSHAQDTKLVVGMRAAGGFAGEMQTKGAAEFGNVSLLGDALSLNLNGLVSLVDVFVPAVSTSGTTAYTQGMRIGATGVSGVDADHREAARQAGVGCAGGFVGGCYGGQIGIADNASPVAGSIASGTWARGLKEVKGTECIGGFVGKASAAATLNADTENASDGYLQKLIDKLISTPNDLVDVLDASLSTIKYAEVTASDPNWGIVVDGSYTDNGATHYADVAGGFAGSLDATVVGQRHNAADTIRVENLRSVLGGYYAGGFFGFGSVGSLADVGGTDILGGSSTSILNLIKAGNISVLDAFRTYIYHAQVTGVADGIRIYATEQAASGTMTAYMVSGGAGGFGGGLLNGTVENSSVSDLNYMLAPNYAAGFIGYMGKDGGVTVEQAQITDDSLVGKLLSALGLDLDTDAMLLDIVGSTVKNCQAYGYGDGFVVETTERQVPIAGTVAQDDLTGSCAAGFTGFADISQMDECTVENFKYAVSPQLAAGFIGRGTVSYVGDVEVSSGLTSVVVSIVNLLVRALYLDKAEQLNLINADSRFLGLKLLADGDLLYVNLLGLKIGVSLVKNDPEYDHSDAVKITLGSSTIKLPCDENGIKGETPDISIQLIEGNRTTVKNSSVAGVAEGYDVFAGGATQDADGSDGLGYAGGFEAYNGSGFLSHDRMVLCDTVRGTAGKVGPFVGYTEINNQSRPESYLEGSDNVFPIYRSYDAAYTRAQTAAGTSFASATAVNADDTATGTDWNRYDVTHYATIKGLSDLAGAKQAGSSTVDLEAYESSAKAVLMADTPLAENTAGDTVKPAELKDPCDETFDLTINKTWNDLFNMGETRPDSITVYIYPVDAGTTPPDELVVAGTPDAGAGATSSIRVNLDNSNSLLPFTLSWSKVVEDLPVAYETADGEIHYYKYYVSELAVDGYETTYSVVSNTASVNITNRYVDSLLPYLGTVGVNMSKVLVVVVGLALLCLGAIRLRQRQRGSPKGGGDVAT